jgi:hypothetical protein
MERRHDAQGYFFGEFEITDPAAYEALFPHTSLDIKRS